MKTKIFRWSVAILIAVALSTFVCYPQNEPGPSGLAEMQIIRLKVFPAMHAETMEKTVNMWLADNTLNKQAIDWETVPSIDGKIIMIYHYILLDPTPPLPQQKPEDGWVPPSRRKPAETSA